MGSYYLLGVSEYDACLVCLQFLIYLVEYIYIVLIIDMSI